jgi:uncharacterized protein (TIGR02611 family)
VNWPDPRRALRLVWTSVVLVVGLTVVLFGVVLIVTPGPAIVVIPAGLAILATEFAWARRLLKRAREEIAKRMKTGPAPPGPSPGGGT